MAIDTISTRYSTSHALRSRSKSPARRRSKSPSRSVTRATRRRQKETEDEEKEPEQSDTEAPPTRTLASPTKSSPLANRGGAAPTRSPMSDGAAFKISTLVALALFVAQLCSNKLSPAGSAMFVVCASAVCLTVSSRTITAAATKPVAGGTINPAPKSAWPSRSLFAAAAVVVVVVGFVGFAAQFSNAAQMFRTEASYRSSLIATPLSERGAVWRLKDAAIKLSMNLPLFIVASGGDRQTMYNSMRSLGPTSAFSGGVAIHSYDALRSTLNNECARGH